MTVVLGIDAAWTEHEPSGLALISGEPGEWRCLAVSPSYADFFALAEGGLVDWCAPRAQAGLPDARQILEAARALAKSDVGVVAIDMPIATTPIDGRRSADTAISREFGSLGCGTHSPSRARPGPLSDRFRRELEVLGFTLRTGLIGSCGVSSLIEVYPHVALLKLLGAAYRVKCKVSKIRKYWPSETRERRVESLLHVWGEILDKLRQKFAGLSLVLPKPPVRALTHLKRYEDALDALVSARVGVCFVEGKAAPYGDETAAIWVPTRCA